MTMTGFEPVDNPFKPSRPARLLPSLLIAGVVAVVALVALTPGAGINPSETPSLPPSPVDGIVLVVDSEGLGQVTGFVLRIDGGWSFQFRLGTVENATEFPPSHLAEHQATSTPIRVYYRLEGGVPVAYRLEDAPLEPSPGVTPAAS